MQVRVLRHGQASPSVIGVIEPEESKGDTADRVPWPRPRGYVFSSSTPIPQLLTPPQDATLILRPAPSPDTPAWLPAPRAAFHSYIEQLERQAGDTPLCLWPTAHAAVSDFPSLRTFLASAAERKRNWTFLFDPISMLTPAMLATAEDHLTRLFESLANHPARWGTLLTDAAAVGDLIHPAPLGTGNLTPLILRLARQHTPMNDVILLDADLPRQKSLLPAT